METLMAIETVEISTPVEESPAVSWERLQQVRSLLPL
jgi:hypothetical protein